mmetsp:Transcript_7688/g.24071  ORF Transcript_7688/g.24071 Transcript_7688/m.24071 type:complete len:214 (-) Transcript_7688:116-757(-)
MSAARAPTLENSTSVAEVRATPSTTGTTYPRRTGRFALPAALPSRAFPPVLGLTPRAPVRALCEAMGRPGVERRGTREREAGWWQRHRGASRCGGRLPLDGKREQDGEQWGKRLHDAREGDGGVHQAPSVRHQRDHHRGDDGGDLGVKERASTACGLPGRNAEAAERRGEQLLHRRDRDWERKAAQNLLGGDGGDGRAAVPQRQKEPHRHTPA